MTQGAESVTNNQRIAKNTLLLYLRMLILMGISLYTSRVILQVLGINDFGLYNVVGGVVSMFTLLSGSLTNSINRYLSFELGKKDQIQLGKVFSMSLNVMSLLALAIFILGETIGLWFLNFKMNIAMDRIGAANWVYQCSLLTFMVNLISIPYNASIVAHEKMSAFAMVSVFEAIMKLGIVFLLLLSPFDKLKTYAVFVLLISLTIRLIYGVYCNRNFPETHYRRVSDKVLLKQMTSFAGWNFFGQGANIINNYGVDIVINLFFGVAINAARGVASQVNAAVNQFVTNFMIALNPQITKSYAVGDYYSMHNLIFRGAKFSFFLLQFFVIPICLEADYILSIWLEKVPEYSALFVKWILIITTINMMSSTLITGLHATGRLKRYMITVSSVEISTFPITYFFFYMGGAPVVAYQVNFCIYFILMLLRLHIISKLIKMNFMEYVRRVYFRILFVFFISFPIPFALTLLMKDGFLRLVLVSLFATLSSCLVVYYIGFEKNEKEFVNGYLKKIAIKKYEN